MSHGSTVGPTTGLSKALAMGLVLIICPSKEDVTMDFRNAWFACDVSHMQPIHLNILQLLDCAVTQNFWVSVRVGLGSNQGLGITFFNT